MKVLISIRDAANCFRQLGEALPTHSADVLAAQVGFHHWIIECDEVRDRKELLQKRTCESLFPAHRIAQNRLAEIERLLWFPRGG